MAHSNPTDKRKAAIEVIKKWLQEDLPVLDIQLRLILQGWTKADAEQLVLEARQAQAPPPSSHRRWYWGAGCIFTFVLFYFLIPNPLFNAAPFFFSFLGAILFTVLLIQTVGDFRSWQEFNTPGKANEDWRHRLAPMMVFPGIIMIFVFYMNFAGKESKELLADGIQVTGTIINGRSYENRRGGTYAVEVSFTTKEGKKYYVKESVGRQEFDRLRKGQEVPMIYSAKNPEMIELLLSSSSIKQFTNVEDRPLNVPDLITILDLPEDSVQAYLSKISLGWQYDQDNQLWRNDVKNAALSIYFGFVIKSVQPANLTPRKNNQLLELGFQKQTPKDSTIKYDTYESEGYHLKIDRVLEGMSLFDSYTLEKKW